MAKSPLFINKAFEEKNTPPIGFHLVPQANSFQAIFQTKPLQEEDRFKIRQILEEGMLSEKGEDGAEQRVQEQLYQITEEIKAISRQGAILLGERVFRARELLKPYRDGTFTKWLEATFSSRKTGYNFLAYYELYIHLPRDDLKEKFKQMPSRAAYILASKEGALHEKVALIEKHSSLGHQELVELIRHTFPSSSRPNNSSISPIRQLTRSLSTVIKGRNFRLQPLSPLEKRGLEDLVQQICKLSGIAS